MTGAIRLSFSIYAISKKIYSKSNNIKHYLFNRHVDWFPCRAWSINMPPEKRLYCISRWRGSDGLQSVGEQGSGRPGVINNKEDELQVARDTILSQRRLRRIPLICMHTYTLNKQNTTPLFNQASVLHNIKVPGKIARCANNISNSRDRLGSSFKRKKRRGLHTRTWHQC